GRLRTPCVPASGTESAGGAGPRGGGVCEADALGMVADRGGGDLLAGGEADRGDLVGAAFGDDAVLSAAAGRGPVGLGGADQRPLLEGVAVHDGRVVVHRPGHTELVSVRAHRQAVVARVVDEGGAIVTGGRVLRQRLHPGDLVGGDVVLQQAVEERDLEV